MGDNTKIEWATSTWSPITGCTPVSAGCANCYAKRMVKRFPHMHESGVGPGDYPQPGDKGPMPFSKISFHPDRLGQPRRWKRPRRIFVCSMGDLFHEDVSDTAISDVLAQVMACHYEKRGHVFMILTKRPERMRKRMSRIDILPNLLLGVTAENQEMADQRIPILLQTPAAKRFVSVEPMLGPVDLGFPKIQAYHPDSEINAEIMADADEGRLTDEQAGIRRGWHRGLDWIICGGESGPGARSMHPDWPRSLRDQCQAAGVPFFFKQWGEWGPHRAAGIYRGVKRVDYIDGVCMLRVGKKAAGCLLDGKEHKEFPEVKE